MHVLHADIVEQIAIYIHMHLFANLNLRVYIYVYSVSSINFFPITDCDLLT